MRFPAALTHRTSIGLSTIGVCCLLTAVPASAQPSAGGYRDDPPPQCQYWPHAPPDFVPVPGDSSAYTRCVGGVAEGVGYCPAGFTFDAHYTWCSPQQGMDTLSLDDISQDPPDPQTSGNIFSPGPPFSVTVTYSGTNIGNVNLDHVFVSIDNGHGGAGGQSETALTADGTPHRIVVQAHQGGVGLWVPQPGDHIDVSAYMLYAQPTPADPSTAQPPLGAAWTSRTFTVPGPPS